jgi:hypothetical protein
VLGRHPRPPLGLQSTLHAWARLRSPTRSAPGADAPGPRGQEHETHCPRRPCTLAAATPTRKGRSA